MCKAQHQAPNCSPLILTVIPLGRDVDFILQTRGGEIAASSSDEDTEAQGWR